MRVLIFTQTVDQRDPILGFFHRWIEVFAQNCEFVTVICLREGEHHLPDNVRVLSLGKERHPSKIAYLKNFYRYLWQLRGSYDAVFVHMNQIYAILGGLYWKIKGIPVGLWYCHKHTPLSLRIASLFLDKHFTSTEESTSLESSKKCVVGHGIDTELFTPDPQTQTTSARVRISMLGRVTAVKNLEALIEAVHLKQSELPDLEALFIGAPTVPADHAYQKSLEDLCQKYGLSDRFHFVGSKPRSEVKTLLESTDLLINLTKTDGFDKALLESWSLGIPVLAANQAAQKVFRAYNLPEFFFTEPSDHAMIADRLKACLEYLAVPAQKEHIRSVLMDHVRREHNLYVLIPRMLKHLQKD